MTAVTSHTVALGGAVDGVRIRPSLVDQAINRVQAALDELEAALAAEVGSPVIVEMGYDRDRPRCDRVAVAGLRAADRVAALVEARRYRWLVSAVGLEPATVSEQLAGSNRQLQVSDVRALELAAIMNLTPTRARNLAFEARTIVESLDEVMDLLDKGHITAYHSKLAADGWRQLCGRFDAAHEPIPENLASRYQRRILLRVTAKTVSDYKRGINTAVAMLSPQCHESIRQATRQDRYVHVQPDVDGMAYLTAYLGATEAARVWQALEHAATNDSTLEGTVNQRMADALVAICDGTSETPAHLRNAAAEIQVLVSLDSLANGQPVGHIAGTDLLLEGSALSDLMNDARFRRLVYSPVTGQLLDFGRSTYRPPTNLRDFVVHRDRTCRAPGCTRPARYCDVDHVTAWQDGGQTSVDNLATLCRTHHVLKTHGGWGYQREPDGSTRWELPSGAIVRKDAATYLDLQPPEDDPPF